MASHIYVQYFLRKRLESSQILKKETLPNINVTLYVNFFFKLNKIFEVLFMSRFCAQISWEQDDVRMPDDGEINTIVFAAAKAHAYVVNTLTKSYVEFEKSTLLWLHDSTFKSTTVNSSLVFV